MKKLMLALFLTVCFVSHTFAAGTMVFSVEEANEGRDIQVTALCTADSSDGSFPDDWIPYDISGKYLYQIRTFYGGTGPTDNTDLQINENTAGTGYDVLNSAGTDRIDNATNNSFQPYIDGAPAAVKIYGPLYMNIDNNSVNSAIVTIVLDFIFTD